MTLTWQVNQSRYLPQGNAAIPGYTRYTDLNGEVGYEVKELPRLSSVEEALEFWSRVRHPNFLPIVHVFEEPARLLVFMEEMPAGAPLATLDALQIKGELLFDYFCELARAIQFMSQQMLSYPHLDLSKIYLTESGLKIIGHESVSTLPTWQRDQVHHIDLRYAPPEWASAQGRTEAADVYHLAALFFHFLTRIPAGAEPGTLAEQIPARLQGCWLQVFQQLLQKDPKARPGWKAFWALMEQRAPKATVKFLTPLFIGKKSDHLTQFAHRCFNEAENSPLVLNVLTPGGDPFRHALALRHLAEKRNWTTLWTAATPCNHPYQTLNDLIQSAKDARLAWLTPFTLAEQLQPLTTWDTPLGRVRRWKQIAKRLADSFKVLATNGLFLLITDAQHLDIPSVEALAHFLGLLEGVPVLLGLGTEQLGCEALQRLSALFPRTESYAGQLMDRSWLEARLWSPQPIEASWFERLLEDTGQREILVPLWLADLNGSRVQAYFEKSWAFLSEAERQFLLVTACSPRQIPESEILALIGARTPPDSARLVQLGWLVATSNGRYRFSSAKGKDRCLEKLSGHERRLLLKRLFAHERRRAQPDLVQLCCLAVLLEDATSKELLQNLRTRVYEQMELEALWAVELLAADPAFKCFQEYTHMAALVRGQPVKHRARIKDEDHQEFARIQTVRGKEPRRGSELYLALSGRRGLGPVKRGYSLVLAVEYAVRGHDTLQANRSLRRLARMDTSRIDPELVEAWWARCLGALRQLGQEPALALAKIKKSRTPLLRWAAACQAWCANQFEQCLDILEEVLPQLADFYDLDWRGTLFKHYGNALYRNYHPQRAIQAYQKALACFQKTDNVTSCEDILFNLASAESLAGHFDSSRSSSLAIYNKAIAANDTVTRCQVLYQLMACDLLQNDLSAFERAFVEHQTYCNQLGFVTERVKSLAMRLNLALERTRDQNRNDLDKLDHALLRAEVDPLLEAEVVFARRVALFALGQADVSPSTLPFHTAWRHRFLDYLLGKSHARFSDLVETMGDGYFGAIHYQVLKTAIVAGLIPAKELTSHLQNAFEQHMNRCNAAYSSFLKAHFRGFQGLKEISPEFWEKAMALFERLVVPAPPSFRAQVMSAIGEVWSNNGWGGVELDGRSWLPIAELGLMPSQDLLDHLGRLGTFNTSRPLVTTFYDQEVQRRRGLLLLPVTNPGQSPALIWILNDHQPERDVAGLYEPLFRFYAKILSFIHQSRPVVLPARSLASHGIVGNSQSMKDLLSQVEQLGATRINLYIWGESGTGKELVARAIHHVSDRASKPFRAINCNNFPHNLVESELFGHRRGAFTGADCDKAGLLELVDGGTLFLDEIGDIDAKVQSLLLRVIQEGEFSRVGEREVRRVNIRFITATHKDIRQMIEQKLFRQDLFFRIVQGEITLPPLRSRLEDLPLLIAHFSKKYFPERSVHFRREFFEQLRHYKWPGNVRELESYVQKVLISWPHEKELGAAHVLPFLLPNAQPEDRIATLDAYLDQQRAAFVFERLEIFGGNRTRTAESLGIARQSLLKLIEKYKIT